MKINKLIMFLFLVLIIMSIIAYNYIYKGHRKISNEKAVITTTASKFFSSFTENRKEFDTNFIDKVIEIKGYINTKEGNNIVLDNKINVIVIDSTIISYNIKDMIFIKGRYVGYDDLLELLKIDQATIINTR